MNASVIKTSLSNGLTILIYPMHAIPKVAVQLWYGVGSKDEKGGERGLAHLLEHMTFKGTSTLSESDIFQMVYRVAGTCNAFTSHDFTCYVYDLPAPYWPVAVEILADCMRNCTFKSDLLQSEVKAVIQELKMYRDDFTTTLMEEMISAVFAHHPYHYPIIGYKHDLWAITHDALMKFYKKHYIPNNATLVVVGDVDPDEVVQKAMKAFGSIEPDVQHRSGSASVPQDLLYKSTLIYRDVQQPQYMFSFTTPGLSEKQDHMLDIARWIIGEGKNSRLYHRLVDELHVATDVNVIGYDMSDASELFIHIVPNKKISLQEMRPLVTQELERLGKQSISDQELARAKAQVGMDHMATFDSISKIASGIGRSYLATGDENALFKIPAIDKKMIQEFFARYALPTMLHEGAVLPSPAKERARWLELQRQEDAQDKSHGDKKKRVSVVEEGARAQSIELKPLPSFTFARPQRTVLPNGLTVLWHDTARAEKIDLILNLQSKYYFDNPLLQGIGTFVAEMVTEGTASWSGEQLAQELETRGITIHVMAGYITASMPSAELSFALQVINELITSATFPAKSVEKIREQIFADLEAYWDNPYEFIGLLAKEVVYGEHPYGRSALGTTESIARITRDDLIAHYKKHYFSDGAALVIVGSLQGANIPVLVEKMLGSWQSKKVEKPAFVHLKPTAAREIKYPIARDQTVLVLTGLSVSRHDPDFEALLLFDQLFAGGLLGGAESILFKLREQTGMFYTIDGSILANVDDQPGLVFVRTVVSPENVDAAEKLIKGVITKAVDVITETDLTQARNAVMSALIDNFESSASMAEMFLFTEHFKLGDGYFDQRVQVLAKVTLSDVVKAVKKVLNTDNLATIRAGRVDE